MPRKRQPVRLAPAAVYGERQALQQQQQAAPMGDVDAQRQQQFKTMTTGQPAPSYSVFAPTQRPGEPITAGTNVGPGLGGPPAPSVGNDPLLLAQEMYRILPHPELLRLLRSLGAQ